MAAIRRADESALKEFFIYFQPVLLEQARRLGIPSANANEIVMTFLDDKVTELARMDIEPALLAGYVVRSFRNRVFNLRRDQNKRDGIHEGAMSYVGSTSQRIVAECEQALPAQTVCATVVLLAYRAFGVAGVVLEYRLHKILGELPKRLPMLRTRARELSGFL